MPPGTPDSLFASIAIRNGVLTETQVRALTAELSRPRETGQPCTLADLCRQRNLLSEQQVHLIHLAHEFLAIRSEDRRLAAMATQAGYISQAQAGLTMEGQAQEYQTERRLPRRVLDVLQQQGLLLPSQAASLRAALALLDGPAATSGAELDVSHSEVSSMAESAILQAPDSDVSRPPQIQPAAPSAFSVAPATALNAMVAQSPAGASPPPAQEAIATSMAPRVAPPVPLHTAPPSGTDTVAILPGALPGSHQRSRRLMYVYRPNRHIRLPSTTPRRTGKVTCPHCWAVFPVEDTLFIARHQDLVGDAVLGPGERQRFLPSRLTPRGNALDAEGLECPDRTCPTCHLRLPRCLYERDSFFVSIVGAPGSGKSYLLTALTWELRRLLPKEYNFVLADADPETNQWLNAYEETLFLSGTPDRPVYLKKTELQGELYQQVVLNGMPVLLPRPAILTLRPQERHLRYPECGEGLARNVVLYDNAGEHFQPGRDTPGEPGTQHLVRSQAIFLVLDPLLDPRFATRCRAATGPTGAAPLRAQRQDLLLAELANRILRYRGSGAAGKVTLPLIVVLTKFDAWRHLLGWQPPEMPTRWSDSRNVSAVDLDTIVTVSLAARDLLLATCPEIVSQAEAFSQHVIYIPVSALGHAPAASPDGMYQVKPADIRAWWVTVPFLYLLSQIGFVPVLDRPARADDPPTARTQVEGDQIHVEVPGSAVHYLIPASHAGHVVRCPKTGSRFRIPSVDVAEAR